MQNMRSSSWFSRAANRPNSYISTRISDRDTHQQHSHFLKETKSAGIDFRRYVAVVHARCAKGGIYDPTYRHVTRSSRLLHSEQKTINIMKDLLSPSSHDFSFFLQSSYNISPHPYETVLQNNSLTIFPLCRNHLKAISFAF